MDFVFPENGRHGRLQTSMHNRHFAIFLILKKNACTGACTTACITAIFLSTVVGSRFEPNSATFRKISTSAFAVQMHQRHWLFQNMHHCLLFFFQSTLVGCRFEPKSETVHAFIIKKKIKKKIMFLFLTWHDTRVSHVVHRRRFDFGRSAVVNRYVRPAAFNGWKQLLPQILESKLPIMFPTYVRHSVKNFWDCFLKALGKGLLRFFSALLTGLYTTPTSGRLLTTWVERSKESSSEKVSRGEIVFTWL